MRWGNRAVSVSSTMPSKVAVGSSLSKTAKNGLSHHVLHAIGADPLQARRQRITGQRASSSLVVFQLDFDLQIEMKEFLLRS